ncbi:MAG: DUF4339 domain-containing protein, partial [Acinetobacter sp.]|nr:DUF4339 domain-containing protein [Acinetobacter sp.]
MQIYLARNNQQAGPYTLEQLNQMLASQQVLLTDLIWHQGMKEWKTVGEVTQGQFSYQPTTINTTQQTTSSNDTLATTNTTSNSTIISHHQPYQEPVQKQNSSAELAGRGKRMIAKFVDLLLLSLPQIIVTALYFPIDAVTRLANEATTANATEQQMQILEQFSNSIPSWLNIALLVYTLFL